jgi:hypothetical protein
MPPWRWFVHKEASADAIHCKRDRREVDDHFVGKAVHVDTTVVGRH